MRRLHQLNLAVGFILSWSAALLYESNSITDVQVVLAMLAGGLLLIDWLQKEKALDGATNTEQEQ